jgi:tetratricopeptide (TPR) repeat protein
MQLMDSLLHNQSVAIRGEFSFMNKEINSGFPVLKTYGFLDVPLILIVAGKDRPLHWENNLINLYETEMRRLSETRMIVLPQSTHYIHNFDPALVTECIRRVVFPDALNILRKVLINQGADSCIAFYKKLKVTYPSEYILERFLNTLGYEELRKGHTAEAIQLFKLNVGMYPNSSNVYDSLGEAYITAGNKKEAIKYYQRSLKLNPSNTNARKILERLNK